MGLSSSKIKAFSKATLPACATTNSCSRTEFSSKESSTIETESNVFVIAKSGSRFCLNPDYITRYKWKMPHWSIKSGPVIHPEMENIIRNTWKQLNLKEFYKEFQLSVQDKADLYIPIPILKSLLKLLETGITRNLKVSHYVETRKRQVAASLVHILCNNGVKKNQIVSTTSHIVRALLQSIEKCASEWKPTSFLSIASFSLFLIIPELLDIQKTTTNVKWNQDEVEQHNSRTLRKSKTELFPDIKTPLRRSAKVQSLRY